jgi:hypothetical protein
MAYRDGLRYPSNIYHVQYVQLELRFHAVLGKSKPENIEICKPTVEEFVPSGPKLVCISWYR